MSEALNREVVKQRLLDFPRDNYLYIGNIVRGVALYWGSVVLLEILGRFDEEWPRLVPWVASLMAVLLTYTTWGRGVILTNSRADLWDTAFPLLLGIDEFCLFGVLSSQVGAPAPSCGAGGLLSLDFMASWGSVSCRTASPKLFLRKISPRIYCDWQLTTTIG